MEKLRRLKTQKGEKIKSFRPYSKTKEALQKTKKRKNYSLK